MALDHAGRVAALQATVDNMLQELEDETARRLALTAAGKPAPVTYSWGGRSVDWNGYRTSAMAAIKEAMEILARLTVVEFRLHAR